MPRRWDVAVIGAGPAGLAAARTVAGEGLSCICIDRLGPGGLLMNLGEVHAFSDSSLAATGPDILAGLVDAAVEAGVEIVIGEVLVLDAGSPWTARTEDDEHEAAVVIVATGLSPGTLGLPDEGGLEGRGLSRCASCDGPLYAGQPVVVAGDDKWAVQEAVDLAAVAGSVTLVGRVLGDDDRVRRLASSPNTTVIAGCIVALNDDDGLAGVIVDADGRRVDVEARGLFAYTGRRPLLGFAAGLLEVDADGRAVVDQDMRTSAGSVYAIGDVRTASTQTVADAIADGRRAGLSAARQLKERRRPS